MKTAVRRKTAINAAAASSLAAALFIGIPAVAASRTVDVPYVCTWVTLSPSPTTVNGQATTTNVPVTPTATYYFPVTIQGPDKVTAGATATITWKISQPTLPAESPMLAVSSLPAGAAVQLEGEIQATGDPLNASATATAQTAVPDGLPMTSPVPLPTLVAKIVPTSAGALSVAAGKFKVVAVPRGVEEDWQTCSVHPRAAASNKAMIAISVAASPSPRTTTTHTATATATTPVPTQTVTATVTASKTAAGQVQKTPKGAAQTGEMMAEGPSARVLFWLGSILLFSSAVMGVLWRRRMVRSLRNGTPS